VAAAGGGARALAVAALIGLTAWLSTRETAEQRSHRLCTEQVKASAAAVWSQLRRANAERRFRSELASGVWTQVDEHMTAEVKGWTEASNGACALAQNNAQRASVQACLEERRKTLDSMGELFSLADRPVVTNAINTVMLEVQPAETCGAPAREAKQDPAPARDVDGMRSTLAKVRVLRAAAKYVPALEAALTVKNQAEDAQAHEILAEAQLAVGELYADQLADSADDFLHKAIYTSEALGNDELRTRAWIVLLGWSSDRDKIEQAPLARYEANALLTKLGRPPLLDADWQTAVGHFELKQDNSDAAQVAFKKALELRTLHLPSNHPLVLRSRLNWALSLKVTQQERLRELQAVREARARLFGPRHAETVAATLELGRTHLERNECDTAKELFDEAVSASNDRVEENPLDAGGAQIDLAKALDCLGQTRDAIQSVSQGLALLRRGGASSEETERVESLLRCFEKKLQKGKDWSCAGR
jgi:tetratricopeptide (TPR) repeat protein